MDTRKRLALICALAGLLVLTFEFAPALRLGFEGDDFELFSTARIGGFSPAALFVPHRGVFLKPVMNAIWASLASLLGARPAPWHLLALLVHLLNALLAGLLAARLSAAWSGPADLPADARLRGLATVATGASAALIWAVHDRLAEPVFSLASLNHSVTFSFYLAALLAYVRALRTNAARDRLLAALVTLLALFSYEVGASLILAAALLVLMDGRSPLRFRLSRFGPMLALCAAAWASIQITIRLAPGMASYYALSPRLALRNLAETGLAFLHIRSDWLAPSASAGLAVAALLVGLMFLARDRVIRFGLAWTLAAWIPIAPIPYFSDRYHYIAFAGIALAAGRALVLLALPSLGPAGGGLAAAASRPTEDPVPTQAGGRQISWRPGVGSVAAQGTTENVPAQTAVEGASGLPESSTSLDRAFERPPMSGGGRKRGYALAILAAVLLACHVVWSVGGAREQAAYWTVRGWTGGVLLGEASRIAAEAKPGSGDIYALVWSGEPDLNARLLARFEEGDGKPPIPIDAGAATLWPLGSGLAGRLSLPRLGERTHPAYVRSAGVLGVVYPADLMNVAGAARGLYFRRPDPGAAARAIAAGRVRVAPLALPLWGRNWRPAVAADIAGRLAATMQARREVPMQLDSLPVGIPGPLRVAWLETVDHAGAWDAEFGPAAGASTASR